MQEKQIFLNTRLVKQQGLNKDEEQGIINLHIRKQNLFDEMDRALLIGDKDELKRLDALVTDLEFVLQDAWRFPRDIKFHKFWERPGCSCPRMDNNDAWPTGYYVRSGGCLIHGDLVNQKVIELKRKEEVTRVRPEEEMVTITRSEYERLKKSSNDCESTREHQW